MEPSGEANSEASSREELAIGHEDFPEGRTYPLNSKRLISGQLQALAKILGLPGGASMEETRQLIEEKYNGSPQFTFGGPGSPQFTHTVYDVNNYQGLLWF